MHLRPVKLALGLSVSPLTHACCRIPDLICGQQWPAARRSASQSAINTAKFSELRTLGVDW